MTHIDIYTLTYHREKETIEKFLSVFTNRTEIEYLKDSELTIISENKDNEWITSHTVTNSINIGLSKPDICFTLYLKSNHKNIESVMLSFTQDAKLIVGLSILEYIDETECVNNYKLATELKKQIQKDYNGVLAYFGVETPPAHSEKEFKIEMTDWENKNKNYC